MDSKNSLFLKGLNELRASAALAVIVHHIELFKFRDGLSYSLYTNRYFSYFIDKLGKNAVYLFFVLSGFLITYLIIKEKERYSSFGFKKFYIRRVLRIWPLYFIVAGISFFFIPYLDHNFPIFHLNNAYHERISQTDYASWKAILTYFGFLSNYGLQNGIAVVGASQSWSVSIEEQFYLLWPILLLLFFRKQKIFFTVLLIFVLLVVNQFFGIRLFRIFQFEYLFIGCLGALLINTEFFQKRKHLLDKKALYISILFIITTLLFVPVLPSYSQTILLSIFYLFLITLTINNKFHLESPVFNELGKISYGIYMYHPFVMFLIFPFIEKYIDNQIIMFISLYISIIAITLFISHLSYHFIEKKFLIIKERRYSKL